MVVIVLIIVATAIVNHTGDAMKISTFCHLNSLEAKSGPYLVVYILEVIQATLRGDICRKLKLPR